MQALLWHEAARRWRCRMIRLWRFAMNSEFFRKSGRCSPGWNQAIEAQCLLGLFA